MEYSVREARAHFASALAAAERGERVTITKNGKPIAEIGPPTAKKRGLDFVRMAQVRDEMGIRKPDYPLDEAWRASFDDPAWTREIFGPEFADEPDRTV